jgi:hypothetical protein
MKIKIKIKSSDLQPLVKITRLMIRYNIEFIDYVDFYNSLGIEKKLTAINLRSSFSNIKNHVLNIDPNEAKLFIRLVDESNDVIDKDPYFYSLLDSIKSIIYHQLSELDHKKEIFINSTKAIN